MSDDKVTLEDVQKMSPSDLLGLTITAIGQHAVHALNNILDVVTSNPDVPLSDDTSATVQSPVPVPFGQLRGRADLGELGILVTVTATLVPLEDYREQAEAAAARADDADPGQAPGTDIVAG